MLRMGTSKVVVTRVTALARGIESLKCAWITSPSIAFHHHQHGISVYAHDPAQRPIAMHRHCSLGQGACTGKCRDTGWGGPPIIPVELRSRVSPFSGPPKPSCSGFGIQHFFERLIFGAFWDPTYKKSAPINSKIFLNYRRHIRERTMGERAAKHKIHPFRALLTVGSPSKPPAPLSVSSAVVARLLRDAAPLIRLSTVVSRGEG